MTKLYNRANKLVKTMLDAITILTLMIDQRLNNTLTKRDVIFGELVPIMLIG